MKIYVDATTLIALGTVDELDLLANFDGDLALLPAVRAEVTTEPARTNLDRFADRDDVAVAAEPAEAAIADARSILSESTVNGDVQSIAAVLDGDEVAVVSDDRRVRTTARNLGARVTGTIGVVVRAVEEGLPAAEGKALVRRIDGHGLHMTGELRDAAYDLVEAAASDRRKQGE